MEPGAEVARGAVQTEVVVAEAGVEGGGGRGGGVARGGIRLAPQRKSGLGPGDGSLGGRGSRSEHAARRRPAVRVALMRRLRSGAAASAREPPPTMDGADGGGAAWGDGGSAPPQVPRALSRAAQGRGRGGADGAGAGGVARMTASPLILRP